MVSVPTAAGCLLGVDWGTSNRRAYLVDRAGNCERFHEDDHGMLHERGRFAESLDALRASMDVGPGVPVVLSGMVGSAQGWQEVPYLDNEVPLSALPTHLVPVRERPGCFIVPGYRSGGPDVDVMRGEETQLLGALALGHADGWVVLPGTHSKWVALSNGRMERWSTYITGELFAILGREGTLAPLLRAGREPEDPADFEAGLALAQRRLPLSNALFGVRARVVSGALPAASARAVVSGLLIGAEFVGAADSGAACKSIVLVGSAQLEERYARAAAHFAIGVTVVDPDAAYRAALSRFLAQGARDAR
jgi:2-dehydro-3-deoxygalactonokinase